VGSDFIAGYRFVRLFQADKANWQKCVPTIKASFTEPGTMKVVWDAPQKELKKLLAGYQVGRELYP